MSLINYVEPVSIGEMFIGIGSLVCALVLAYIFYECYGKLARWLDVLVNRADKYMLVEELMLDDIAKKKGLDLDKELMKRNMINKPKNKSFQQKLQNQIYEEWFGKESKEKAKK